MATFNPFNPDGTWNWQNVGIDEEDIYENIWQDAFRSFEDMYRERKRRSGKQLTEELARALILSNLDKFDVHYAEYWQRQRRMQMNEAKSKIGQLSIVSQRTTAEQFKLKMWQSPGSTSSEVDRMYSQVYGEGVPVEISDRFAKLLMSPLFKWNS